MKKLLKLFRKKKINTKPSRARKKFIAETIEEIDRSYREVRSPTFSIVYPDVSPLYASDLDKVSINFDPKWSAEDEKIIVKHHHVKIIRRLLGELYELENKAPIYSQVLKMPKRLADKWGIKD